MVSISVSNGTPVQVSWTSEMNAQKALELACASVMFGVTYYGSINKYMVVMLNGIYDSQTSGYYWAFYYNSSLSNFGLDSTILNDGDKISFINTKYNEVTHKGTLLEVKYLEANKN